VFLDPTSTPSERKRQEEGAKSWKGDRAAMDRLARTAQRAAWATVGIAWGGQEERALPSPAGD